MLVWLIAFGCGQKPVACDYLLFVAAALCSNDATPTCPVQLQKHGYNLTHMPVSLECNRDELWLAVYHIGLFD